MTCPSQSRLVVDQWILLEQPSGATILVHLRPNRCETTRRSSFNEPFRPLDLGRYGRLNTDQVIGLQAGLYYEILPGNKISPLQPTDVHPELSGNVVEAQDEDEFLLTGSMATNEGINDDNQAQRLTTEDIEALKALHASGETSASVRAVLIFSHLTVSVDASRKGYCRKRKF